MMTGDPGRSRATPADVQVLDKPYVTSVGDDKGSMCMISICGVTDCGRGSGKKGI